MNLAKKINAPMEKDEFLTVCEEIATSLREKTSCHSCGDMLSPDRDYQFSYCCRRIYHKECLEKLKKLEEKCEVCDKKL